MAEMIVSTPLEVKYVDDYDFVFVDGATLNITLDHSKGDTIQQTPDVIKIYTAPRPSMNDPKKLLPEEHMTLFKAHLAIARSRQREVVGLTAEQQIDWAQTVKQLANPS